MYHLSWKYSSANLPAYFDKQRGHPLGGVVVARDAVDHSDGVDQARNALQHANLKTEGQIPNYGHTRSFECFFIFTSQL